MRIFIRNRLRQQKIKAGNIVQVQELKADENNRQAVEINTAGRIPKNSFAAHMDKYIGETITVFVKGGGTSGFGFTGVLMFVNCSYIKLITRPLHNCEYMTLGCIACMPIDKIAAIVHNIR
ncbi:MAG TPA: hypothetical protein VIO64_14645 [Pseudobacteroides sp.]|uniref:hypothetical protein n=1 Tax=Pseudobacteroides sp. TaxID=1968840 RepID=UPI002F945AA5